jgi:hypothetical protein
MRNRNDDHPYYRLDPGEPRVHPDDYRKMGIEFDDYRNRRAGNCAGLGPKGYRRPDDRVCDDICRRLTDDPHVDATGIDVKVEGGLAELSGTVADRFAKRRAEDIAWEMEGVCDVQNRIRIQQHGGGGPVLTSREPGANLTGTTQRS